jgi:hypothetical protein
MILSSLLLASLSAHAAAPARMAPPPPPAHESDLAVESKLRLWAVERKGSLAEAPAGFTAEDKSSLKDAVSEKGTLRREITIAEAAERSRLARRLPGISEDPFNVCRTLERCHAAPTSFHVEDEVLIPDALVALARPWIALEKARGRRLMFTPSSAGNGLLARLETANGALEIRAAAAATGGFDVWISESDAAARRFLAEKAEVLGDE